jgi:CheY-like chemotaxis protein
VVVANDGAVALDWLHGRGVPRGPRRDAIAALVLLDLNLPKLDGREVMQAIRADPATRHLPVVALSSSGEPFDTRHQLCVRRGQLPAEARRLRALPSKKCGACARSAARRPARLTAARASPLVERFGALEQDPPVAMNLSPPRGRLPRCVWVKAVGAINRSPVRGAMLRCWKRNSVSPASKPSLRYTVHNRCRCSVSQRASRGYSSQCQ